MSLIQVTLAGFLTIDFNPKTHRFRKAFDTYIPSEYDPGKPAALHHHLAVKGADAQPDGKPGSKHKSDKPQPVPK